MSVPTPIIELIAQQIVTRLSAITTAGGYSYDVGEVVRPTRQFAIETLDDKDIVLLQGDAIRDPDHDTFGNPEGVAWTVDFSVVLFVLPSDTDTSPLDTQVNLFASDAIAALTLNYPGNVSPPGNWQQFADAAGGPLALDSSLGNIVRIDDEDAAYAGVAVPYNVTFRHAANDATRLV